MQSSGLREVLAVTYAENTVLHMLSGKEVTQAIRGHSIVYLALFTILMEDTFYENFSEDVNEKLKHAFIDLIDCKTAWEDLPSDVSASICDIRNTYEDCKSQLLGSETAQLWLQYMDMYELLTQFIRAQRTEDFYLHMSSLNEMLFCCYRSQPLHYICVVVLAIYC